MKASRIILKETIADHADDSAGSENKNTKPKPISSFDYLVACFFPGMAQGSCLITCVVMYY